MSAFLLPNAGGGQEPDRVRHDRLVDIYIYLYLYLTRNRVHNFIAKNLFATFSSEQYMWND